MGGESAVIADLLEHRKEGRDVVRVARTPAERQAAYRARKGQQLNIILPPDIKAALDDYMARHRADHDAAVTVSDVVCKLLRTQLLRKR
jgi:hypothetical protein